ELKREKLVAKYAQKRAEFNAIILDINSTEEQIWKAQIKLQKLPENSSASRVQRRCKVTGIPHALYRKFGLCRNNLREYAMAGD
ncbi:30S ribosomal protein S14, partial [Francisella tularensis subsp. holarctica]|uniref:30S ribosomal protein S14 n=1 Tax=Francisella tularensis TaxID=263 RepID=UPI002381966E